MQKLKLLAATGLLTAAAAVPAMAQIAYASAWTAHADNGRTGANLSEATLTTSNVNSTNFGKLFTKSVDGDMYGQPLYLRALTIGGTIRNVVLCSTANNTLYAFDGDDGTVATLWSRNLGTAVPQGDVQCCCTDVSTVIGIIGTGAIDLSTGTWYVVHKQKNADATYHYFLHGIDVTTGNEKFSGPVEITASSSGLSFNPKLNNQRSAMLLQNGVVYLGFSSHNDCGDYHGWILGYNASTLVQTCAYVDTITANNKGGIWQAGGGLVGDGVFEYFQTGNGNFNLNSGGSDAAMSVLRLNNAGVRQDYFTPTAWSTYNGQDRDLSGGGMMWIPGTRRTIGGGKDGHFYLVNMDSMGGFNSTADACVQSWMVTDSTDSLNHLHGPPTFFNSRVYVGGESDELKAFAWNGSTFGTTPATNTSFEAVSNSMPGWQTSVSANGNQNGIIWASRVFSGNANNATQPGIIHAFDANNLGTELWNSKQNATRDDVGNFAKDPAPVVANGRLYCPTFSNQLVVYGPLTNFRSGSNGVMATWRLDETSGTSASDSAGNGNTGTVTGTATWGAGRLNNAFTFNGSSYISCGDAQTLNSTNAISVTGWFKTSQGATATASVIRHDGHFTALQITAAGNAQTAFWANGTLTTLTFPWTYNNNAWHHYASTYDMTQGCKIYVDGTLVASNTTIRGPLSGATVAGGTTPTPFMLGAKEGGSEFYTGSLDEVSVWNRALSQTDISSLAAAGVRAEAEQALVVKSTAGIPVRIIDDTGFVNAEASILDGTAVGNQIAYLLPSVAARTYDVHIGVKKFTTRAIVQPAGGTAGNNSPTNIGSPVDMYSATASFTDIDLGNWTPTATGDQWIWFTATGKNASSTGFTIAIDYIKLQ